MRFTVVLALIAILSAPVVWGMTQDAFTDSIGPEDNEISDTDAFELAEETEEAADQENEIADPISDAAPNDIVSDIEPIPITGDVQQSQPAQQTLLLVQASIIGSAANAGDTFQVEVTVTNVGNVPSLNTRGDLRNTPDSWIVSPPTNNQGNTNGSHMFGIILPGESAQVTYTVTRDDQEPGPIMQTGEIWFRAFADNAPVAESGDLKVPIHPLVAGMLATLMLGSGFFLYTRRVKGL
ncbi:MAG: hypothetical protein Q8P05_00735 [Candidatus Diapherotrites archaeon]|nr:hypothetical protein [Candidatus Diapherotrites archaeon]MDZ4256191.1 hypothetical protein [archaeon]